MKIKNIFFQKNFLIPAILLVVIASVTAIVILSSDNFDSNFVRIKQIAQVGSTCVPNPTTIIKNGDFEQLTENAEGPIYFISQHLTFAKEVCFFEGNIVAEVRDQISNQPSSNNVLWVRYFRHAGEGQSTSPWFNAHQSLGVVQNIGNLTPGTYNLELKIQNPSQSPLVLYIGFSNGPILRNIVNSQAGCFFQTDSLANSTAHNTKYNEFETCVLGQLESYTQITVPPGQNLQTYTQEITIDQAGLNHLYLIPFGPDPYWTVPPGSSVKPSGALIIDDITLVNQVCPSPTAAFVSQQHGPAFYNQGGQPVIWGLGNFIGLSQIDPQPLSWNQYNAVSSATGGQGFIFQRPSNGTFVVTPLSPYTNYTLQDIQQMFSFLNTSITGIQTVYNSNGPFVYIDNFLRQSLFARMFLPKLALADINIPHYIVSYTCLDGLNSTTSSRFIPVDIDVTKIFLDNTVSSTDRQVKYLVTVKNNSLTSGATGVVVKDLLPGGFQYVSQTIVGATGALYDPQTGLLNIPFLGSGNFNSAELTITANIPISVCGLKTNTATLQSLNQTDFNPNNNSASVSLTVACLTTKTPTNSTPTKR